VGTTAPDALKRLVESFDRHFDSLHTAACNETQLRIDYRDPFFEALGWDVANRAALTEWSHVRSR
jgi:hypothetical protein